MMKETPWLEGNPTLPGVYKRKGLSLPFSLWDGSQWMIAAPTASSAAAMSLPSKMQIGLKYRGLAAPA